MKNIKVLRSKQKTVVIYYNGQPYAKIIPKRPRRKISDEAKVIIGMLIFFAMVIGGGFFFNDTPVVEKVEAKEIPKPIVIEKIVKVKDDSIPPILKKIASCEGITQFDKNGKVMTGKINKEDKGALQINEKIWGKKAKELGFDIYTMEGNYAMGKWLLENYGSVPWVHSAQKCWIKKLYQ